MRRSTATVSLPATAWDGLGSTTCTWLRPCKRGDRHSHAVRHRSSRCVCTFDLGGRRGTNYWPLNQGIFAKKDPGDTRGEPQCPFKADPTAHPTLHPTQPTAHVQRTWFEGQPSWSSRTMTLALPHAALAQPGPPPQRLGPTMQACGARTTPSARPQTRGGVECKTAAVQSFAVRGDRKRQQRARGGTRGLVKAHTALKSWPHRLPLLQPDGAHGVAEPPCGVVAQCHSQPRILQRRRGQPPGPAQRQMMQRQKDKG